MKICKYCKKPIPDNDVVRIQIDFGFIQGDRYVDLCNECYNKLCDFVKPALPEGYSVERTKNI